MINLKFYSIVLLNASYILIIRKQLKCFSSNLLKHCLLICFLQPWTSPGHPRQGLPLDWQLRS